MKKYKTIVIDPPWEQTMSGRYKRNKNKWMKTKLDYPTMTIKEISNIPVGDLAEEGAHLWLWTTNQFLEKGFFLLRHWGFKYLAPITWVKPSGMGNWFVHRTQTMLFGYKGKCIFSMQRYKSTVLQAKTPKLHSQKPEESYKLIEQISPGPYLELFARRKREGWDVWGNEVESDIDLLPYKN